MSTRHLTDQGSNTEVASVVLVCTACQHTWEYELPDPTDRFEATSVSCRLCGGWTWVGEITEPGHAHQPATNPSTTRSTSR